MPKCTFCSSKVKENRGKAFVRTDNIVLYFCGSKCERNFRLGRTGKRIKWTESYRKAAGKKEKAE
ncbi:MAG: 50S ribosomal protein L24e [Candidatus Aenigmarchaeota archaeon]|nr:50S ribosomal protein L24e [Candidatus Aenigmarchaeota archaeon]